MNGVGKLVWVEWRAGTIQILCGRVTTSPPPLRASKKNIKISLGTMSLLWCIWNKIGQICSCLLQLWRSDDDHRPDRTTTPETPSTDYHHVSLIDEAVAVVVVQQRSVACRNAAIGGCRCIYMQPARRTQMPYIHLFSFDVNGG